MLLGIFGINHLTERVLLPSKKTSGDYYLKPGLANTKIIPRFLYKVPGFLRLFLPKLSHSSLFKVLLPPCVYIKYYFIFHYKSPNAN